MNRIKKIAQLIPNNSIIADIGCDHAYLAIELFKLNKLKFAYLIDNKEGPIKNALKNIDKYKLNNKCKIIRTNGLNFNFDKKINTLIFAGLGGKNVIKIIEENFKKIENIKYIICDIRRDNEKFNYFLSFLNFKIDKYFIITDRKKKYHLYRFIKI